MRIFDALCTLLIFLAGFSPAGAETFQITAPTGPAPIIVTNPGLGSVLDPIGTWNPNSSGEGGFLHGDWDSSGDMGPPRDGLLPPPDKRTLPFRYDCRVEMTDHNERSSSQLYAIADFSYTNEGPETFTSKDFNWRWVLKTENGRQKLYDRKPRSFTSNDRLSLTFSITRNLSTGEYFIGLSGSVSLAVNPNPDQAADIYWVTQTFKTSAPRTDKQFSAKGSVYVMSADRRFPALTRDVQVMCEKIK